MMDKLSTLSEPLATVQFSFLEQLRAAEAWNDTLLDIFKIFDEFECSYEFGGLGYTISLIYANKNHIFLKELKSQQINIYKNSLIDNIEDNQQLIILCSNKKRLRKKYVEALDELGERIMEQLVENGINYRVADHTLIEIKNKNILPIKMIEEYLCQGVSLAQG